MTRIIAGRAGSLALEVPDAGTRPTSDRVRESLFGALESADALRGAAVLDLYAGSGALGLEAVSRGAASADLVEKAPRAASVVQRNVARVAKSLGRDAVIRVHRTSAVAYLQVAHGPFDLVFLDPPYDLAEAELTHALQLLVPISRRSRPSSWSAPRAPRARAARWARPRSGQEVRRHRAVVGAPRRSRAIGVSRYPLCASQSWYGSQPPRPA